MQNIKSSVQTATVRAGDFFDYKTARNIKTSQLNFVIILLLGGNKD